MRRALLVVGILLSMWLEHRPHRPTRQRFRLFSLVALLALVLATTLTAAVAPTTPAAAAPEETWGCYIQWKLSEGIVFYRSHPWDQWTVASPLGQNWVGQDSCGRLRYYGEGVPSYDPNPAPYYDPYQPLWPRPRLGQ